MRHLVVVNLLLNKSNQEKGVTLLEVVLVSVIVGIMAAMSVPNLLEEQRQQKVNEAFGKIRGALVEAQINANRKSENCTVTISETGVTGSPSGCVLENITYDNNIVEVRSTAGTLPQTIAFEYDGSLTGTLLQTIHIKRKNGANETGKCIVIANQLGMIRTGIYDSSVPTSNCNNVENKRYDLNNP
ncbi:prepilin-type N-terminal cleavage/methylation domain-containing protein [Cyanobacterium aponinum UTEX 3222]|uniref:pilus assembly FimT family protein n=1 Tax=Cyanobacterium aponinum TaxID=379064 RepID=UPI000C12BC06|nr:prepilin-type N-terminal cleavage/methylation domain-containing protein [Cyanobacterium aponinum]PHV64049.1 prepilin-type cleavage/methylation domain-containing protein [Cyanobacterium aponinum IPPAS B-1201]WRL43233.1 prepilin-type N-terminal cleavage/methylation domain-containing protein [Cyanobacterium aponinum UTEX 3222]